MANRRYTRFFAASVLSILGDWCSTVATIVLVYRLTGSIAYVASSVFISIVPRVLLGPIAGPLADRFDRRRLIVVLDLLRAGVALLPLLVHDARGLPLVLAMLFILQSCACLAAPAQNAYIGLLVDGSLLEVANAANSALRDAGMFLGPLLATLIIDVADPSGAFIVNSISFIASAGLIESISPPRRSAAAAGESIVSLHTSLQGYLSVARRHPGILGVCLCYFSSSVPLYLFQGTIIAYAHRLHLTSNSIGIFYAAAGFGGIIGGICSAVLLRRVAYKGVFYIFLLDIPLLSLLPFLHSISFVLLTLAASTAVGTTGDVLITCVVQRGVKDEEQGRVFGLLLWCIAAGQLCGALIGTRFSGDSAVSALVPVCCVVFPVAVGGTYAALRASQQETVTLTRAA